MNFEDLQNSWKNQQIIEPADFNKMKSALDNNWNKYQHKLLRTNLSLSLSFLAACLVIGWVYFTYKNEFNWPFDFSIATTYLLMFVYLAAVWKSYAFKKENMEQSSTDYIFYQLKKLKWQRQIITIYSWIYAVLLWMAIVCYIWEITIPATSLFRYIALGITSVYIFTVNTWYRLKKQNKQLKVIDEIKTGLIKIRGELVN